MKADTPRVQEFVHPGNSEQFCIEQSSVTIEGQTHELYNKIQMILKIHGGTVENCPDIELLSSWRDLEISLEALRSAK